MKTIKSTQLPNIKEPLFWEGVKKFNTMKRITFVLNSEGEGKNPIKSRLSTDSYLVPINIGDYIIKIFIDIVGIGITILRVLNINNLSAPEVEVVKRKASNSNSWFVNEESKQIKTEVEDKIQLLIKKTEDTKN